MLDFTNSLVIGFTILVTPALAIVLFGIFKSYGSRSRSKFPPGDRGLPFVGCALSFFKPHPCSCRGDYLEKHLSKYGNISSVNLFGEKMVLSADPELNRFVLQNEMRLFKQRLPSPKMHKLVGDSSLILMMGETHRQKRSVLLNFFGKIKMQASFIEHVDELAAKMISSWKHKNVVRVADETSKYTFGVVATKALGVDNDKPETEQLRKDITAIHHGIFALPIYFPGTLYSKALKARVNVGNTIKQIIDDRKVDKNRDEEEDNDLIDYLMKDTSFTLEMIHDTVQGFILGGQITTSSAIALAIYFLHGSPKAVEQMREERLQAIRSKKQDGMEKLTWDDYKKMEFTQSVISEVLRLGNVARLLRKTALKDIEYKGYVIPEGTTVLLHLAAVHLDPSSFENPEHFNPWRWQSSMDVTKTKILLPFGGGVRHCVGWELARIEIAVFLHHLILNYNWELIEPDDPIPFPLPNFPKGLPIRVRQR
ncbi:cholesterol 16,22-dihydroxylase CYP90G4-like [Typha angustifolia]|uniref:cholesterol 16,22-dihydroxylase CYP90G4-like n=1 Tax=Typha angustifolia TaxID=59011 RepID=UPI003C2D3EF1